MQVKKGSTDQTVYFPLHNDSDSKSKTGLVYNSAGAVASYIRTRGTRTAISLATLAAADSAHADGGFKEVDGTNAKGLYRLDVPDAAFASGVDEVVIHIGFTDVFEESLSIELVDERSGNPTANTIADQVWDEILTGATHNIATSAGRRLREIAAFSIHSGTAQAGAATTITLAAGANGGDGIYNRNLIVIIGGTGAGQTRTITDYDDTTKVCAVDREWHINPDATSEYQILADDTPLTVDHGIARGGTLTTLTLRASASSVNNIYLCNIIAILGGTGRGQARLVGGYNGTTKVVTICGDDWVDTPDTTSIYAMIPYGTTCTSCVGTYALAQIAASVAGSGALSCTWTQKDDENNPMDNVQVWISTDEAGNNVVAGTLITDASGEVTFMLDAGTYYVFRERGGFNFQNPQEWTVS